MNASIPVPRAVLVAALAALLAALAPVAVPAAGSGAAAGEAVGKDAKTAKIDINTEPANARRVEFTTEEGTWMSVDVSPDGGTILFDLLGDIYRLPIAGGTAERVTSGPAYDYAPRFSPDGKLVVFCSDRGGNMNLWLMAPDGSGARPLTEEKDAVFSSPSWTRDGRYVVARREDTSKAGIPPVELWMYHRDGGSGIKVIGKDKLHNVAGPVAAPDGRYLYLSGRERRFNYVPQMAGLWNLYRFDRVTGDLLKLTGSIQGGLRPTLSPDGALLAYARRDDARTVLVLRDLATGGERVLRPAVSRDEEEGFAQMDLLPGAAFTPDGRALVYWSEGKIHRTEIAGGRDTVVPFRADVSLALRPLDRVEVPVGRDDEVTVRLLRWPTLSPDGRLLAFEAIGRVWIAELRDGKAGAPRRLTRGADREYAPAFSPDGRSIAFVTWSDRDLGHVVRMPAGGGAAQRLTKVAGHYANPAWSPKGDRVAFIAGTGAERRGEQPEDDPYYEIAWVPASPGGEGSDLHKVTAVATVESLRHHPVPAWAPDGERIFFAEAQPEGGKDENPKVDLVSVRLDGTDKRRHLRFTQVEDAVPSPDGAWVAFVSDDDVYVTAMPEAGKDPVEVGLEKGAVPIYRLSAEGGGYIGWADGGRTIVWGMAGTIYRQDLDQVRAAAQKKAAEARRKAAEGGGKDDAAKEPAAAETAGKTGVPPAEAIPVTLKVARARPAGSILLRHGRIITMRGDEVLADADILVKGDRIAAVGPGGTLAAPAGAATFDLGGKTVIPGLVDVHAHLHYSAFEVFPQSKWEYIANLAYGVTTTHDPSAHSIDVFAQAEMVEAGEMTGPRIYSSGDVLYGGQQAAQYTRVDSLEDARSAVRRMKAYGALWLKVYQQPRREQRLWFMEAARSEGIGATMEGAGELHTDTTNYLDGFTGMEHALPVALYDDMVTLTAKSGTAYTPTLIVAYGGPNAEHYWYQHKNPHDDERLRRFTPHEALDGLGRRHPWYPEEDFSFPTVAAGAAKVARAGGRVCLGAHGQLQGLGAHWELWSLTAGGAMTPMEALRTATWSGAEALGFGKDLGTIESGKLADLVVIDGDPLKDIQASANVAYTMKNGMLYEAATMNEVWPERRPLPPFFWREPAAVGR
jgi:Tol biopolymer transport system component/imidazolonepropionase-like amidohydrolase